MPFDRPLALAAGGLGALAGLTGAAVGHFRTGGTGPWAHTGPA